jgi:hypothetical protein
MLSSNPNAVHLFCSLDYNKMVENMKPFCNELVAKTETAFVIRPGLAVPQLTVI